MRILFVTTRPPWPIRRGDQARTAGWVEQLSMRHTVAIVSQRPPRFPPAVFPQQVDGYEVLLSRFRMGSSLWRSGAYPIQAAIHYQARLEKEVGRVREGFKPDVVVLVLSRLGWLAPAIRDCPVVLDLVDSLALNMRNRATRQPWLRPLWNWEAWRLEKWDHQLVSRVARATVVSERDKVALCAGSGISGEAIRVVPFGVNVCDAPTFDPGADPVVLLSGNLGYFPTREGALWFGREVWPKIRQTLPKARWLVAGARPTRAVQRLGRIPGVEILADPGDLSAVRKASRVAIAPMRSGSGTPIKILEAMAEGVPVVATPEAAAGLDGLAGNELRIAEDPKTFAASVTELLKDSAAAEKQAAQGWSWVRGRHALGLVAHRFESVLEAAITSRQSH